MWRDHCSGVVTEREHATDQHDDHVALHVRNIVAEFRGRTREITEKICTTGNPCDALHGTTWKPSKVILTKAVARNGERGSRGMVERLKNDRVLATEKNAGARTQFRCRRRAATYAVRCYCIRLACGAVLPNGTALEGTF